MWFQAVCHLALAWPLSPAFQRSLRHERHKILDEAGKGVVRHCCGLGLSLGAIFTPPLTPQEALSGRHCIFHSQESYLSRAKTARGP